MKRKNLILIFISCLLAVYPLSQKEFVGNSDAQEFSRGDYLIILGGSSLLSSLENPAANFVEFKKSQGYDVEVQNYSDIAGNQNELRDWLEDYSDAHPLLEYVLLIGDVTGSFTIPTHIITSYNDDTYPLDQTDYPYTFFSDNELYNPRFFIGRWSVQSPAELLSIVFRNIVYGRLIDPQGQQLDGSYLNNALLVAGNYADPPPAPLTPVWTSRWLKDKLESSNYSNIDEFYYTAENDIQDQTSEITASWSDGVGIINYRGWGDGSGWKYPEFKSEHINSLTQGWELPVVFSFVCNTGDFGNEGQAPDCFGEKMIKYSTGIYSQKGAVAMVGPSDLDTDTKYNNVICAEVWDELLENRISELGPALHAGKQAVLKEFGDSFIVEGAPGQTANIAEFYHHIYGVLGDPSLSVWIKEPSDMNISIVDNFSLYSSFVGLTVSDENNNGLGGVVGALIYNGELIGKALSNANGWLAIQFNSEDVPLKEDIKLYLNKDQYRQKLVTLNFGSDNGSPILESQYRYAQETPMYTRYSAYNNYDDDPKSPEYNWIEINQLGTNLELTDDSHASDIPIGFDFQYYGQNFSSVTVSSNGWISFLPTDINYFWNFSIPFPIGPNGMVAPFMDDLDDNDSDNPPPLDVYYHYDSSQNIFIVEWDEIHNGEDNQDCDIAGYTCVTETFQVILYDPDHYPTETGDGEIKFQYKEIHDIDNGDYDDRWGNYSTIGIESPDQNYGVQYQFRNQLEDFDGNVGGSQLVENEMAILFTTEGTDQLSIKNAASSIPDKIELLSNYPNPFNPTTQIAFKINKSTNVTLVVTDISGREISKIYDNKFLTPGIYNYDFEGQSLSSGVYIYTLKYDSKILTSKMLLLK